jgi:hypothetical protein
MHAGFRWPHQHHQHHRHAVVSAAAPRANRASPCFLAPHLSQHHPVSLLRRGARHHGAAAGPSMHAHTRRGRLGARLLHQVSASISAALLWCLCARCAPRVVPAQGRPSCRTAAPSLPLPRQPRCRHPVLLLRAATRACLPACRAQAWPEARGLHCRLFQGVQCGSRPCVTQPAPCSTAPAPANMQSGSTAPVRARARCAKAAPQRAVPVPSPCAVTVCRHRVPSPCAVTGCRRLNRVAAAPCRWSTGRK